MLPKLYIFALVAQIMLIIKNLKKQIQSDSILADHIDEMYVDQIFIVDAYCCNELRLLEKFYNYSRHNFNSKKSNRKSWCYRESYKKASKHIDKNLLVIASECDLGLLNLNLAKAKLKIICEADSRFLSR